HVLLSCEPEKPGSKVSFQPAGTVSSEEAAAGVFAGLCEAVGLGVAFFLALAEPVAVAEAEAPCVALITFEASVPFASLPFEEPRVTASATRPTASTT